MAQNKFGDLTQGVKIDVENMRVDPSTEVGQMLAKLNAEAGKKAGTPEGDFMAQMLGYAEAAMVVTNTMQGKDAEEALSQLRDAMGGQG